MAQANRISWRLMTYSQINTDTDFDPDDTLKLAPSMFDPFVFLAMLRAIE